MFGENHGHHWNGRDLRKLKEYFVKRMPVRQIASRLGRSVNACSSRWSMIRTGMLYYKGSDNDTLREITKALEEVNE